MSNLHLKKGESEFNPGSLVIGGCSESTDHSAWGMSMNERFLLMKFSIFSSSGEISLIAEKENHWLFKTKFYNEK